jgi:carbon starvation protein CstA
VPVPLPQHAPPPVPTRQTSRRGRALRGCLILVVLIIILVVAAVFAVPAVLLLLQEEQARPSINEPRIR